MGTDHFPVKCRVACRFKKEDGKLGSLPTQYSNKQLGKLHPMQMNAFFKVGITRTGKKDYQEWAKCYRFSRKKKLGRNL